MPVVDSSGPRPAFCEDYDDEAGTTISSSRATAQLPIKKTGTGLASSRAKFTKHNDGSDSGYSSKTGTVSSEAAGARRPADLKIETSIPERERHPYHMSSQAKPKVQRGGGNQVWDAEVVERPERPFVHHPGVCMTCDRYGRHLDAQELEQIRAQPSTPSSPKASKKPASSAPGKQERDVPLRRYSSSHDPRSANIYPPSATQTAYAVNPAYVSSGYATPVTPTLPYSPATYTYESYAATPISSAYGGYAGQVSYFEPAFTAKPQVPQTTRRPSYAEQPRPEPRRTESVKKPTNPPARKESAVTAKGHKTQRSIDDDRKAMPPPELPAKVIPLSYRPSLKKTSTYDVEPGDRRRSRDEDGYGLQKTTTTSTDYDRKQSSYPPTSRPHPTRKSVSYSDAQQTTKVAKTAPKAEHVSRQSTMPTTPLERKEAEAEAYQRRRSKMTSEELTAEKLTEYKRHTVSSKSETGSTFSHKESHQSSSRASSGRVRSHTSGHRTSIIISDGLKLEIPDGYLDGKGRPVSINLAGLTISAGSKDKDWEQRLLEKAPSVASHASKRSVADSGHGSPTKTKSRDHRESQASSRRPSYTDERSRPPVASQGQRSYRQRSRTRSSTRDYDRNQRQSRDYDDGRQYYGA